MHVRRALLASIFLVGSGILCLHSRGEQAAHALPQAVPGSGYAAQLAIPPGLGYPFAKCELLGDAPRWLSLDCARLQLKGKVPAASAKDADLRLTLRVEDNAGNAREFPLSLRVSAEPQVVSLDDSPPPPAPEALPPPAAQVSAAPPAPPAAKPTAAQRPRAQARNAPLLRDAALIELAPTAGDAPGGDPSSKADAAGAMHEAPAAEGAPPAATAASDAPALPAYPALSTPQEAQGGGAGNGSAPATTPTDVDLGLTRYYFVGGTVLSQQQDQFSHTDLFLGFHLDRELRAPGSYIGTNLPEWTHLVPGISSLLDIRMTSLPVAVQPCPAASTTCSNKSTGSSTPSTPATGDQTQVFLNSQKSARFEGGVYLPFQLRHWTVTTKSGNTESKDGYVVDFAPIAKIGFDTSLNGLNQTQQSSNTPSTVLPTGSSNSFYKFWDYGGRLVWSKIPGDKPDSNEAPDIMGYIDIGIGRFSNLATLLCPPGSTTLCAASPSLNHQFQYRIPMEGALEIPGAKGLTIGFSANLSQRGIGPHHYDLLPPDDLRFLFGYKVDVTKFFKNVFGS